MKTRTMKSIRSGSALLAWIIFSLNIQAQPYQISFSGSGLSTTVSTVEVQNLTQGTTLTLNGSDILELVSVIGIEGIGKKSPNSELKIWPNPSTGECRIGFYNPEDGDVVIEILEVSGKSLYRQTRWMSMGYHCFSAVGMNDGMNFLRVSTLRNYYVGKVAVAAGESHTSQPYLINFELIQSSLSEAKLSSVTAVVQMQYNAGERLLFRGNSGIYSRIITLIPIQSQTVDFNFIDCTDGDGNHYPVITIESQTWMAKNLKATRYNNSDPILKITDPFIWATTSATAYCWYNNDSSTYAESLGAIYNWYAAEYDKLCPVGWHVPGYNNWSVLVGILGGQGLAGNFLKETGTQYWNAPNAGATNATGFSARAGGYRSEVSGGFYESGVTGRWWESLDSGITACCGSWVMGYNQTYAIWNGVPKLFGHSIRCIKD